MKKLLKILPLVLIIILLSARFAIAEETEITRKFSDLDETYWAYEGINKLTEAGIIDGYPDGTFQPDGNITRAELVKITNMVFEYKQKQESTNFSDVMQEDWFYDNVLIAQNAGYIDGYPDGTFQPDGLISREEFCKILDVINNFIALPLSASPADEVSPWAVDYVNRVISNRIMTLDENNNFRAVKKATRAEVCDTLAKFTIADAEGLIPSPGGQTGGSPGGSSGSDDELTKEELYETMDRVIRRLTLGVVPNLSTEGQKEIVEDIILNMKKYQENNSYDYEKAAEKAYDKYKLLTEKEGEELKYQIQLQNTTQDLLDLQDFFFPDMKI